LLFAAFAAIAHPKPQYKVYFWQGAGIQKIECISYHVSTGVLVMLAVEKGKLTRKELSISAVHGITQISTHKIMRL